MSYTLQSWECSSGYCGKKRGRGKHFLKFNSYRFDFLYKQKVFMLPVSEVALVPSMPREGVAFPPHVGFDRASKLVRHTTAGSPHGTKGASKKCVSNQIKIYLYSTFLNHFWSNQCFIVHIYRHSTNSDI